MEKIELNLQKISKLLETTPCSTLNYMINCFLKVKDGLNNNYDEILRSIRVYCNRLNELIFNDKISKNSFNESYLVVIYLDIVIFLFKKLLSIFKINKKDIFNSINVGLISFEDQYGEPIKKAFSEYKAFCNIRQLLIHPFNVYLSDPIKKRNAINSDNDQIIDIFEFDMFTNYSYGIIRIPVISLNNGRKILQIENIEGVDVAIDNPMSYLINTKEINKFLNKVLDISYKELRKIINKR